MGSLIHISHLVDIGIINDKKDYYRLSSHALNNLSKNPWIIVRIDKFLKSNNLNNLINIKIKIFHYTYQLPYVPKCEYCDNNCSFISFSYGYRKHCSQSCANIPRMTKEIGLEGTKAAHTLEVTKRAQKTRVLNGSWKLTLNKAHSYESRMLATKTILSNNPNHYSIMSRLGFISSSKNMNTFKSNSQTQSEKLAFKIIKLLTSDKSVKEEIWIHYDDSIIYRVDILINKLVIEVDGDYHDYKNDKLRDKRLNELGYTLIHIKCSSNSSEKEIFDKILEHRTIIYENLKKY